MKKNKIISTILIIVCLSLYIYTTMIQYNIYAKSVSTGTNRYVNPIGRTVGLKLYTNGVLVVGMSEVDGIDGNKYKPYENSGIKEGDMIKEINGQEINNTQTLINIVNSSDGQEISIKYERNNELIYTNIMPIKGKNEDYMLGLWVRDAAAGIGTLTYYEEATKTFAALGHGRTDVDTGNLLNISNGELVTAQIVSIVKGVKGRVGEIRGIIDNGYKIGTIESNTGIGVYGTTTNIEFINSIKQKEVEVASRKEITTGDAKILCELENGKVSEYKIKIKKIYKNSKDNKSMLIEITDEELINKTGGIIPGMSGTPIIQNNKFIGAITNVLLNSPTEGYAIFADMMMR